MPSFLGEVEEEEEEEEEGNDPEVGHSLSNKCEPAGQGWRNDVRYRLRPNCG